MNAIFPWPARGHVTKSALQVPYIALAPTLGKGILSREGNDCNQITVVQFITTLSLLKRNGTGFLFRN